MRKTSFQMTHSYISRALQKQTAGHITNHSRTRLDTRAKTVRRALLILRSIPSSIRPTPSSIQLTVDEYDNEGNDQKHEFLHLSLALLDLTVEKYDNE